VTDLPAESAADLYHGAPCGYLSTRVDGTIFRVNQTFLDWTGLEAAELVGRRRFVDLLTVGGRMFHETHYAPLLLLQGEVREIAFDLICADGQTLPVLVNARLLRDDRGEPLVIRATVNDASARREYERELLRARHRAEASEAQVRGVAEVLQRSLMHHSLTDGPGFLVETRYRPAVSDLEVGGDWHDAFWLPGRATVAMSVGDVVGRGIAAACAMGQIRSAIRAVATAGPRPGRLLDQLDLFVADVPDDQMATVAYAELDVATGRVGYACAGHPPPLVIHPNGAVETLGSGRSLPLAVDRSGTPRPEATITLSPGSRLLLFTDGLIERPGRTIDDALAGLVTTLAGVYHLPVAQMVDELTAVLLADEDAADDVCVLCLDYRGPAGAVLA
jgi:sigma-B regulation protein RsbU (phosphoserine phosphatase)